MFYGTLLLFRTFTSSVALRGKWGIGPLLFLPRLKSTVCGERHFPGALVLRLLTYSFYTTVLRKMDLFTGTQPKLLYLCFSPAMVLTMRRAPDQLRLIYRTLLTNRPTRIQHNIYRDVGTTIKNDLSAALTALFSLKIYRPCAT